MQHTIVITKKQYDTQKCVACTRRSMIILVSAGDRPLKISAKHSLY